MPAWRTVDALKAFRSEFPTVSLRLYVEALGAVTESVLSRTASIGISGPLDVAVPELERVGIGSVELIPVSAPDHPLARAGRNAPGAGRDHIQLVLTDRTALTQNWVGGIVGLHLWRFADLATRLDFLLGGFGWCNMPSHMVADHIEAGRLKKLRIAGREDEVALPIYVVHERGRAPGRAGRWLIADLRERLKTCPGAFHQNANELAAAVA